LEIVAALVDLLSGEEIGRVDDAAAARGIPGWVRRQNVRSWTQSVDAPEGVQQIRPDAIALVARERPRKTLFNTRAKPPADDLDEILRERMRSRREEEEEENG
jgi:hypothetical protein